MRVPRPIRFFLTYVPNRWRTYFPFLPVPPWNYIKFRQDTMYGRHGVRMLPRMVRDFPQYYRWWCNYEQHWR